MKKIMSSRIAVLLMSLLIGSGMAQADDPFDPTSPPDPLATYKLSVSATPAGCAATSGTGRHIEGAKVYVNTSGLDTDYVFRYWELNGEFYTASRNFYFTMPAEEQQLVAIYEYVVFDPSNPSEPNSDYARRVFLRAEPAEACSFNYDSGTKFTQNTTVMLRAITNQGFDFVGWYSEAGLKLASTKEFAYMVPEGSSTLVARFEFNPESPGDPDGGGQLDVDNPTGVNGDINGDDVADVADMQRLLNIMKGTYAPAATEHSGDINADGVVDVADMQRLLNIMKGL